MRQATSPIDLFRYTDYREYLRDWFAAAKKSRAGMSYRTFSEKAGLKSFNFIKLVMEGERNLTEESLSKFMLALKLNKQEQDFFRNIVFYNQAKTHDGKNRHYAALVRSRKFSQLKPIESGQYDYYSAWYHPAVRELAVSRDCDGTPEWIARTLHPAITAAQAERSLHLLEKLGFLKRRDDGKWRQADTLVSTGAELQSHVVHQYHKLILDLTKQVMDDLPPERRDVSTMTLGVEKERLPQLKKMIQDFRREVLKLVSSDTEPHDVVQLNIQMFPLTQTPRSDQGAPQK